MGRTVVVTEPAIEDLRAIVEYIARDNPSAAHQLAEALLDKALGLAEFPHRGALYRRDPPVRRLTVRGHRIYYHVPSDRPVVEILHFWHGARRNPRLPR